jgi:serine/threonine protein kinase
VSQLGEGGFGVVHLVREKATSEQWAAKTLKVAQEVRNGPPQEDRMTRADIRNECEILKMMDHPSICKLHEHFEVGGGSEVVMVLELLSGGDLLDSVIANGTYSEADAREIFTQVLDGVAHIHHRGVVHRDLKVCHAVCARVSLVP